MAKVKHIFQSTTPDSPDVTLVQPSAWNDDHEIPVDGIMYANSSTNDIGGVAAGASGMYFRTKPGVSSIDYEFTPLRNVYLTDYQWSQTPGGSLVVGSNTITLSPVPIGVNGSDTNLRLRVSGGVGTAEVVSVSGGTAVSGSASGTITFTAANAHSGSWSIATATAGLAEAAAHNTVNASITVPAGSYQLYSHAVFTAGVEILGAGDQASMFYLNDATQDVIRGTSYLGVSYVGFTSNSAWQTSGAVLKMSSGGRFNVRNVFSLRVFDFIDASGAGLFLGLHDSWHGNTVNNVVKYSSSAPGLALIDNVYADGRYFNNLVNSVTATVDTNGTLVIGTLGLFSPLLAGGVVRINFARYIIASVALDGSTMTLTSSAGVQSGVLMVAPAELLSPSLFYFSGVLAGATITNLWTQACQVCVSFDPSLNVVNEVVVSSSIFDQDTASALAAVGFFNGTLNPSSSSNSIIITGCYIATWGWGALIQYFNLVTLQGNFIRALGYQPCVTLVGCSNIFISGNNMLRNATLLDRHYISLSTANSSNVKIFNNIGHPIAGTLQECVMDNTTGSTIEVVGNSFNGPSHSFINSSASSSANSVVSRNHGSFSTVSIASATTITLPVYDSDNPITITGITGIDTINGAYANRRFTAYIPSGLTFSSSGNIITAFTAPAGSVVNGIYSSTSAKWFLS